MTATSSPLDPQDSVVTVGRPGSGHLLESDWRGRRQAAAHWLQEIRLRWLLRDIDRLDVLLAEEFATTDTAPMHTELETLLRRRDALLKRLSPGT